MNDGSKIVSALGGKGKIIFWSVVIVVIILAILYIVFGVILRKNEPSYVVVTNTVGATGSTATVVQQSIPTTGVITQNLVPIEKMADKAVDITSVGFSPSSITIKQGGSVIWTVRDKSSHWIEATSSDPYPESGTCGNLFNSCNAISLGQSFRMTFNKVGTWNYYDKLHPQFTGTVVVQ